MALDSQIESILFIAPRVTIYGIPPLKSLSRGYRASEWDTTNVLWEGRLKVVEIEDLTVSNGPVKCELRLEDTSSSELFASAPYSSDGKGVDTVSDSSRFFAIRVVNGTQSVVLGMGFADRSEAFEFNLALQDFKKHSAPFDDNSESLKESFSLKADEKIHINLKGGTSIEKATEDDQAEPIALLPPPPASSRSRIKKAETKEVQENTFDDDFGDFQ